MIDSCMPGRMNSAGRLGGMLLCLALVAEPAAADAAAPQETPESRPLQVGTRDAPPFAMQTRSGRWEGIAIDLWRAIADELDLQFELQERSLKDLLDGVASGELDLVVAALTVTPQREVRADFSHPFYATGLAIAAPRRTGGGSWLAVVDRLVSVQFLAVVSLLALLLLLAGLLVWLFEGRRNREMFGGGAAKGLASGFWWAAVTMTTVGYGDKAPQTLGGRVVALIWMFASLVVISSFTAAITTSLTIEGLSDKVRGLADLPAVQVGAVADSSGGEFLAARGVTTMKYPSVEAGLQALVDGRLDAFVHDEPLLQYAVNESFAGQLVVLPETFHWQHYAFAMPPNSPLRERINRRLLTEIDADDWEKVLRRYLGSGR